MLLCLAPALCTSHCDVCNEWVGLGNATAEQVLREAAVKTVVKLKRAQSAKTLREADVINKVRQAAALRAEDGLANTAPLFGANFELLARSLREPLIELLLEGFIADLLEELCVYRPEGILHAQRAEGDEEVAEQTGSARAVQPIRAGHGTTHRKT